MHRFFVPPAWLQHEPILLTNPLAHQLRQVLRLRPGEHIILLDDTGWAYEAELDTLSSHQATAHVVARLHPQTEPRARVILYQALSREKKFDWVLQKGTELGATAFVPLLTRRGLINEHDLGADRAGRWQRIVTEAAEQSGRTRLPAVLPITSFVEACRSIPAGAVGVVAWEGEREHTLHDLAGQLRERDVHLLIGPEGGFTDEEAAQAREAGLLTVSLGPRILRTETAGVVALSIILYVLGELG